MTKVKETTRSIVRVRSVRDEFTINPRTDWDNLGTLWFHKGGRGESDAHAVSQESDAFHAICYDMRGKYRARRNGWWQDYMDEKAEGRDDEDFFRAYREYESVMAAWSLLVRLAPEYVSKHLLVYAGVAYTDDSTFWEVDAVDGTDRGLFFITHDEAREQWPSAYTTRDGKPRARPTSRCKHDTFLPGEDSITAVPFIAFARLQADYTLSNYAAWADGMTVAFQLQSLTLSECYAPDMRHDYYRLLVDNSGAEESFRPVISPREIHAWSEIMGETLDETEDLWYGDGHEVQFSRLTRLIAPRVRSRSWVPHEIVDYDFKPVCKSAFDAWIDTEFNWPIQEEGDWYYAIVEHELRRNDTPFTVQMDLPLDVATPDGNLEQSP